MKGVKRSMKARDLDGILKAIRDEPVPACQEALEAQVLKHVRNEGGRPAATESFGMALLGLAFRPGVLAALLVITASLGVVTTTVAASQFSPPEEKAAEDVLGFASLANPRMLECHHCLHQCMPAIPAE